MHGKSHLEIFQCFRIDQCNLYADTCYRILEILTRVADYCNSSAVGHFKARTSEMFSLSLFSNLHMQRIQITKDNLPRESFLVSVSIFTIGTVQQFVFKNVAVFQKLFDFSLNLLSYVCNRVFFFRHFLLTLFLLCIRLLIENLLVCNLPEHLHYWKFGDLHNASFTLISVNLHHLRLLDAFARIIGLLLLRIQASNDVLVLIGCIVNHRKDYNILLTS